MISESEARRRAGSAVLDRIGRWDIQGTAGWIDDDRWTEPKFISCDLVQMEDKMIYVLKGFVYLEQERSVVYLWGGGSTALLLLLVKLDAKTHKVLMIGHVEREWELNFNPSVEQFDKEWEEKLGEAQFDT